jgi:PAT family beta-lactamase induction signal transducer AmpG
MFPSRRIWIILLLGFASGLPLALTSSTLTAWYTQANISLMSIGMLSLVGQPYVYKFFWAPLVDRYDPLKIGRRRSWMLITQIGLFFCLLLMSQINPALHPIGLAGLAFLTAIFSATQDIAISAYLTEAPESHERGLASSFYMSSYRIALMVAGAGALIIAQYYGLSLIHI